MTTYLIQQPKTLKSMTITQFGNWMESITTQLIQEKLEDNLLGLRNIIENSIQNIENIRTYLYENIPRYKELHPLLVSKSMSNLTNLYEKTAKKKTKILRNRDIGPLDVIVAMFDTLLSEHLSSLNITRYELKIYGNLLNSKAHMLTGLTSLKLQLYCPKSNSTELQTLERDVITFVRQLYSLKHFSLNHYCTDNILKSITSTCTLIEELDVSKSGTHMSDSSVDLMTQFENLKTVSLCGTSVSGKGIKTLLMSCQNIENINFGGGIAHTLQQIASSEDYAGQTFKLKSCTTSAPLEQLQLMIQMCPLIENLSIHKNKGSQSNLMAVTSLEKLNELKLVGFNLQNDQVKEMLQRKGSKLDHLHLEEIDDLNLKELGELCPYLETLSIVNCNVTQNLELWNYNVESPQLTFLKTISMDWHTCYGHYDFEDTIVPYLLSNCRNVEYIYIGPWIVLTEELLLKILDRNPLIHLRELKMWQKERRPKILTPVVINRLIQNCMNCPEVIQLFLSSR